MTISRQNHPESHGGWKDRWQGISASRRQKIVLAAVALVAGAVLWQVAKIEPGSIGSAGVAKQEPGNLFGQADSRGMTLTSIQQQLDDLQRENRALKTTVGEMTKNQGNRDLRTSTVASDPVVGVDLEAGPRPPSNANRYLDRESTSGTPQPTPPRQARLPPPGAQTSPGMGSGARPPSIANRRNGPAADPKPARAPSIRRMSESEPEPSSTQVSAEQGAQSAVEAAAPTGVFIPAGSIFTGVLLAGVDAPTGRNAGTGDPIPVLARVKEQAILPNRFRADVRECFIVASAIGDLSSERAYMRGEALSCVRTDGGVIETRLAMYGVGEDGKAGVRGRLVSKQAQAISRALIAGFADGMARAFQPQRIPVLATDGSSSVPFQSFNGSAAVEAGALGGMGSALERLAQFYIRLAEAMFPVIEVDAGREISFVVTAGGEVMLLDP